MALSLTMETIPPEILQRIAIFVGTSELQGPPTDLASLCRTSRLIHASLALQYAPSIYATIFRAKFDILAPTRRLGHKHITAACLAEELCRRFTSLQRFRLGHVGLADLWVAIFMMLEATSKNTVQLGGYAMVDMWLREFLLVDEVHGAGIRGALEDGLWPPDTEQNTLVLWLLWLRDADRLADESWTIRQIYCAILRPYALGAPKYAVTHQSWVAFSRVPGIPPWPRVQCTHYGITFKPVAPSISVSAILGYTGRIKHRYIQNTTGAAVDPSLRWDSDWARCVDAPAVHRPGALEGAWEGLFTYTEFNVYAAILAGGSPHMLHDRVTGQNLQVWRLREYHLHTEDSEAGLPPGDVLDAFFPNDLTVTVTEDQTAFLYASKEFVYTRVKRNTPCECENNSLTISDAVVYGEGHSSWGSFRLRGRIRSSDAFVTILKEYSDTDDRGRWLYRGYLVGGKLIGRWRDSFSPSTMHGYEGIFELDPRV